MTAEDENLDLLLSLFEESNGQNSGASVAGEEKDNLDNLFDDDGDEGEDYAEPEEEEEQDMESANSSAGGTCELNKSKEDLEEELRSMQEKMQKLQQQLEASQKSAVPQPRQAECNPSSRSQSSKPSPATQHSPKHLASLQQRSKPALQTHSSTRSPPTAQRVSALSPPQQAELKQRTAHQPKAASSENQSVLGKGVSDRLSQPARNSAKINDKIKSPPPNKSAGVAPPIARQATPRPSVTQDATVEKFSGLRLRRPRLSSVEIEHKMANRRMIKLSQLPDRLARDNLEDSDWVTFAVVISKITPQSKNNGKTFSIWKLNDLHNLEVNVSLFLFGTVHTDLWKTDTGTVIGILNPNQMKNKDGANELSLTVDHPQKVLILGEAMDFGTCKAKKKNGDSCTQLVNLYECQFCQYHVKAQYKKMSSKRAELQSSFTGSAPGKRKGQGGLRERLCQSDFHYGGMSSLACAPSITAPQPKKQPSIQTVLASIPSKKLGLAGAGEMSGCSDDFKSLMSMPTPGALNIKRHLGQAKSTDSPGSTVQSISAIDLLKQQKELHKQRLQARQKRAEEIQKRVLQNTGGAVVPARPSLNRGSLHSQKASPETKGSSPPERRLSAPPVPTLGRGFMEGEDILLDMSPPPPSKSLSAAKMAAVRKLQAKGVGIVKDDPNSVKRKRPSSSEINTRVQRNLTSPEGETTAADVNDEEPAHKKRREQLEYIQSEEFQRILNARSSNSWIMGEVEAQTMQDYFEPLVQKEKLEEKMKNIREMKCRAVTCKNCKYTHFKPADRCVEEKHDYHWHDAVKRFFKCPCGQRKISLGRLPNAACSNCGLFKWERDGMLKEKNGPKIGGELLLPRGEEQPRFLNSMK